MCHVPVLALSVPCRKVERRRCQESFFAALALRHWAAGVLGIPHEIKKIASKESNARRLAFIVAADLFFLTLGLGMLARTYLK